MTSDACFVELKSTRNKVYVSFVVDCGWLESLPRMFREVSYALYFYPRINQ
jgi:hypothetical protein